MALKIEREVMMAKTSLTEVLKNQEACLSGPFGRYSLRLEGKPTCSEGCPAGVDVKAYINLIADKRFEEAVEVIRRANPFPGVCGRVCTHPCEDECRRGDLDDPLAIRMLKRFASDFAQARKPALLKPKKSSHKEKIAVVGSGPAGLTAASDLAREGYEVVVFEAFSKPGGIMEWGIPEFRLPKKIVRQEITEIEALGVNIKKDEQVSQPARLLKKDFSAVILAAGCQVGSRLDVEGEDSEGILDCLAFLKDVNIGKRTSLRGKTVVIGGGSAALDAARTALRLGSEITVAYRRTAEEMPVPQNEIAEAREEGVKFEFLAIPRKVLAENGKVKGLEFQRASLGEPDKSGRRAPVPVPGEFFTVEADNVIRAIGSKPETSSLRVNGIVNTAKGTVKIDEFGRTSVKGIFAAGDLVTGPATIVEAIGSGHAAARGVIQFLTGGKRASTPEEKISEVLVIEEAEPDKIKRAKNVYISIENRRASFDEVEVGWEERVALAEASRCRRCGACSDCTVCLSVCQHHRGIFTDARDSKRYMAKLPATLAKKLVMEPGHAGEWKLTVGKEVINGTLEPFLAKVNAEQCIACGLCDDACVYRAIRIKFNKGGAPSAIVDQASCRECGACSGICPTGAISQGYMSSDKLLPRIGQAAKNVRNKNGIVTFSCMWLHDGILSEEKGGVVELPCTRSISPGIILEAFACGAKGVAVFGCEKDNCHFLPTIMTGKEIIELTKAVLNAANIDARRLKFAETGNDLEKEIKKFSEELGKIKVKQFQDVADKLPKFKSPMARGLAVAHALMAQPDVFNKESVKGGYLLSGGCIHISDPMLKAYWLEGAEEMLASAEKLLAITKAKFIRSRNVLGPGANLRAWGLDDLRKAYAKGVVEAVKKSRAEGVLFATPKAYAVFKDGYAHEFGGWPCDIISLPGFLKDHLDKNVFKSADEKIAFHGACGERGAFTSESLALLRMVPGLEIIEIKPECGESGWLEANAETRKQGLALLREAELKCAKILVVDSPRCLMHLKATLKGWRESQVRVIDVYSFLASRIKGGE